MTACGGEGGGGGERGTDDCLWVCVGGGEGGMGGEGGLPVRWLRVLCTS